MRLPLQRRLLLSAIIAVASFHVAELHAQATRPSLVKTDTVASVQTFKLKHLNVKDAARLIAPYLQSARSGAFEAGEALGVITVRGTPEEVQQAVGLLAKYDRSPRTVRLRFQLIEPTTESTDDPRIRSVSTALRELFDAPGYKLLGEGMVLADESAHFNLTIAGGLGSLHLNGYVQPSDKADSDVGLQVSLYQNSADVHNAATPPLFSGSLTTALGNVVVIGSAAPKIWTSSTSQRNQHIILTVHPLLETKR